MFLIFEVGGGWKKGEEGGYFDKKNHEQEIMKNKKNHEQEKKNPWTRKKKNHEQEKKIYKKKLAHKSKRKLAP